MDMQGIAGIDKIKSYVNMFLFSFVMLLMFSQPILAAPYEQDAIADNLLVFEAEHFDTNTAQGAHAWSISRSVGYAGSGAIEALPNINTDNQTSYIANSPVLTYRVNFATTGTHYVWIRARAQSANDDSLHVGLNGQAVPTSENISGFTPAWSWSNLQNGVTPATINITATGLNEINIWMGQDGIEIDKILITTNASYIPSSIGPVESLNGLPITPGNIGGPILNDSVFLANQTYTVTSNITVNPNVLVTIQEGASIVFSGNFGITVAGTLRVLGSEVADVIFTTSNPAPTTNSWRSITLNSSNRNVIERANIQYAYNGVIVNPSGYGEVHNSLITNNRTGISARGNIVEVNNPFLLVSNNSIYNNVLNNMEALSYGNAYNVVINANNNWWGAADYTAVHAGIFDQGDNVNSPWVDTSVIWSDSLGTLYSEFELLRLPISQNRTLDPLMPYEIISATTVNAGATLTIPAGTTIQANTNRGILIIDGTIRSLGTQSNQVVFTGPDVANYLRWDGILIRSNDPDNLIEYTTVEYSGMTGISLLNASATIRNSNIRNNRRGFEINNSNATISDNVISNNSDTGIFVRVSSNPVITRNTITGNGRGIYVGGDGIEANNPLPVVTENSIYNNIQWNYYAQNFGNPTNVILNANNNWWGTTDFVVIHSRIYDQSDSVSSPWVDTLTIWSDSTGSVYIGQPLRFPVTQDQTLNPATAYEVVGNLTVAAGATLTIPAGTTLLFGDVNSSLNVDGIIRVMGTALNPVVFTSLTIPPANSSSSWSGIIIRSNDPNNLIEFATIEYARNGILLNNATAIIQNNTFRNNSRAIRVEIGSTPLIRRNLITNNFVGIYVTGDNNEANNPVPVINENSLINNTNSLTTTQFGNPANIILDANNNWWGTTSFSLIHNSIQDQGDYTFDRPWVDTSTIWSDDQGTVYPIELLRIPLTQDWALPENSAYEIIQDFTVGIGITLTIEAGVTINAEDRSWGYGIELIIDGTLRVLGTANNPVTFTHPTQAARGWGGITIRSSDPNNLVEFAIVEYAANGIRFNNATATIRDNLIRNNLNGLFVEVSSNPIVTRNVITNNNTGINVTGDSIEANNPVPVVTENSIYNNTSNNFYAISFGNAANATLNANNNWWGLTSFQGIHALIYDQADSVSAPWVDTTTIWTDSTGIIYPVSLLRIPVTQDRTLPASTSYVMFQDLLVSAGVTLTIESGVQIAAEGGRLLVDGVLRVNGTEAAPVRFTTARTPPGRAQWGGIYFRSNDSNNLINYAIIEYAGTGIRFENAMGTVSNSVIQNNTNGIAIYYASNPTIINNTIVNNIYGIALSGTSNDDANSPQPIINGNDIYNNSASQLVIYSYGGNSTLNIDLTGNWWGTATPQPGSEYQYFGSAAVADLSSPQAAPQRGPGFSGISLSNVYFSPNSDGNQDNTVFSGVLTTLANWTVNVTNGAGASIRTYSGTGTNISVNWDGRNTSGQLQTDGRYAFVVSATISTGQTTQPAYLLTNLDVTPPTALISAPLNNAVIQNIEILNITGQVTDLNFQNYLLEYSPVTNPTNWTAIETETANTIQVVNGLLGQWEVGSSDGSVIAIPTGQYNLRISVTDLAGNTGISSNILSFTNVYFSNVSYDNRVIRPLDGEVATITYTLNAPATVTWEFLNELTSVVVRQETQVIAAAGIYNFTWDGRDDAGNFLTDEAYRFRLSATNGVGTEIYDLSGINIPENTAPLRFTRISTAYNPYTNDFYTTEFYVRSPYGARLDFNINPNTLARFGVPKFDNTPVPAGSPQDLIMVYWDGRTPSGDIQTTRLNTISFFGSRSLLPDSVIINGTVPDIMGTGLAPNIEVKSNPFLMVHSYDQLSTITYRVNIDSFVTVTLLPPGVTDVTDPSAIRITDNRLLQAELADGTPIDQAFTWDGLDDADRNNVLVSEEGSYTFVIQAASQETGFSSTYRGALQLYQ